MLFFSIIYNTQNKVNKNNRVLKTKVLLTKNVYININSSVVIQLLNRGKLQSHSLEGLERRYKYQSNFPVHFFRNPSAVLKSHSHYWHFFPIPSDQIPVLLAWTPFYQDKKRLIPILILPHSWPSLIILRLYLKNIVVGNYECFFTRSELGIRIFFQFSRFFMCLDHQITFNLENKGYITMG